MEVTLSACLVASGYTLPLLMVSAVGSDCLAQQVPNLAMGNSTWECYSCRWLLLKGLGLKHNTLRTSWRFRWSCRDRSKSLCLCCCAGAALEPAWQQLHILPAGASLAQGVTQPGCGLHLLYSRVQPMWHPAQQPPPSPSLRTATACGRRGGMWPSLGRTLLLPAMRRGICLLSLWVGVWGAGYPVPLTSPMAEAQLLPPPSQAFSPVRNTSGVIIKTQLHHSSPAQTSNYSHLRGLHLQLSHVHCDCTLCVLGMRLLSQEPECRSKQHCCLLEEITCLCSET